MPKKIWDIAKDQLCTLCKGPFYYLRTIIFILYAAEKCKKNYYTVTGYITALSQSVSDSSLWHSFKPENGRVAQVVAKNNLHVKIC